MNALFISDLHLTPERPAIARAFLCFMHKQAPAARALYILGDFFEYWLGDDAMESFHHEIAKSLRTYVDNGHHLFFMAGNRDFAIDKRFLKRTGARWLADPCTIELNGEQVLLSHGDLLCTDDIQYQKYRRRIRNPMVLWLLRQSPLSCRKKLADKIRSNSQKAKTGKSMNIMDVNVHAVAAMMEQYQVKTLIHGHTHRPAIHSVALKTGTGQRIVLGDWDRLGWVLSANDELKLESFNIPEAEH